MASKLISMCEILSVCSCGQSRRPQRYSHQSLCPGRISQAHSIFHWEKQISSGEGIVCFFVVVIFTLRTLDFYSLSLICSTFQIWLASICSLYYYTCVIPTDSSHIQNVCVLHLQRLTGQYVLHVLSLTCLDIFLLDRI